MVSGKSVNTKKEKSVNYCFCLPFLFMLLLGDRGGELIMGVIVIEGAIANDEFLREGVFKFPPE